MGLSTYIVPSEKLVHRTLVEFGGKRLVQKQLHFVQYDKSLPLIEVSLYVDGSKYYIPEMISSCKIRWSKPDNTFVYKDALGCDETRNLVYFELDEQMTYLKGEVNAILELIVSGSVAGSSPLSIVIDANPIQEGDIESAIEMPLAPVAFTGNFYDLSNRPETMGTVVQVKTGHGLKGGPITQSGTIEVDTDVVAEKKDIPEVNNGKITIKKNGVEIKSFSTNQKIDDDVNITIPTTTEDLTNNSGFIKNSADNLANYYLKTQTYTKSEVNNLISSIPSMSYDIVTSLPTASESYDFDKIKTIYLVHSDGSGLNYYSEYICVNKNKSTTEEPNWSWELIGTTQMDFTDYIKGPRSSTNNAFAVFDGTTGKLLRNSNVVFDPITGDIWTSGVVIGKNGMSSVQSGDLKLSTTTIEHTESTIILQGQNENNNIIFGVYNNGTMAYFSLPSYFEGSSSLENPTPLVTYSFVTAALNTVWDEISTVESNISGLEGSITILDVNINALTNTVDDISLKLNGIASGATKTESSSINGNIKINNYETVVYKSPITTTEVSEGTIEKLQYNNKDVMSEMANKDSEGNVIKETYLKKTGDTMTGTLIFGNEFSGSYISYKDDGSWYLVDNIGDIYLTAGYGSITVGHNIDISCANDINLSPSGTAYYKNSEIATKTDIESAITGVLNTIV